MQEQCVAIVTCVQNKSDAIAEQFGANIAVLPFIAVDSVTRMGDTAARFTLGEQVQRDPATVLQTREAARARAIHTALAAALRAREGARFPSDGLGPAVPETALGRHRGYGIAAIQRNPVPGGPVPSLRPLAALVVRVRVAWPPRRDAGR